MIFLKSFLNFKALTLSKVLTVVALSSLWGGDSAIASGSSCENVFLNYEVIAPSSSSPAIHPFNSTEYRAPIGTVLVRSKDKTDLRNGAGIAIDQLPSTIYSKRRGSDGNLYLEVRPLYQTGMRYIKVEEQGQNFLLKELPRGETPFRTYLTKLESRRWHFKFSDRDISHLAEKLSQSQMSGGRGGGYHQGKDPFIQANELMLEQLLSNKNLDRTFLETLNFKATENDFSDNNYFRGKLRGTINSEYENQKKVEIDLSEAQVRGGMDFYFAPANQVPKLVDVWLHKINLVSPKTSMAELLELYKEYIQIHPFMDGNGRTSRTILDYLFIKGGFGPLPQGGTYVRKILTLPPSVVEKSIIESMHHRVGYEGFLTPIE